MTSVVGGAADQKTVTLENSGTSSTLINQVLVNSVTSNLPDSNYLIVNDHCSGFALGAQATCSFDIRLQNVTAIQNLKDYISINYPTGCGSSSDITSNNFIGSVSAAISPTPTPMPTVKPTPTPSPSVAPTPIQKKIVFSSTMYLAGLLGNFSGVNFADNLCQTVGYEITGDATATYKALIVDGKNRVACTSSNCAVNGVKEHKDWVLAPNTKYYDPETGSTPRIQTDSNGLIAIARAYSYSPHSNYNWTGLNADWTTGDTCSHWSVSDSSQKGVAGNPLVNKNSAMYSAVSNNCGTPSGFYCVQQ
jgi:hypothetical protein